MIYGVCRAPVPDVSLSALPLQYLARTPTLGLWDKVHGHGSSRGSRSTISNPAAKLAGNASRKNLYLSSTINEDLNFRHSCVMGHINFSQCRVVITSYINSTFV